jgi:hypothetical protein
VLLSLLAPLLRGQMVPKGDASEQFAPYFSLLADHIRQHQLLTWNPWTDGGMPMFIEPQAAALSPLTIACAALFGPTDVGYRYYWCLLWTLAAVGMFLLARHLRAPRAAAIALGLGYALSGPLCGNAEHIAWVYASALLPWVIWRWDATLTSGRLSDAMQAGALFGLCALGGYPGLVIAMMGFCILWLGCRWAGGGLPIRLRVWLFTAVVATLVAAPLYVSYVFEAKGFSHRAGALDRPDAIGNNALSLGALWTLVSPSLPIQKLGHRTLWPDTDVSSISLFCGLVPLALALFALVSVERWRWRVSLAMVALVSFVTACGRTFPLRGWLYDLLPPFRYFQQASLFRVFAVFTLCVLGAESARALWTRSEQRRRLLPASLLFAVVVPLAYWYFMRRVLLANVEPMAAFQCCAVPLLIVAAMALPPSRRGRGAAFALLGLAILVDGYCTFQISIPTIGDVAPWQLQKWAALDRAHVASLRLNGFNRAPGSGRDNYNLLTKQPELHDYSALFNWLHRESTTIPDAEAMVVGAHRVWFAATAPHTAASEKTLQELRTVLGRRHAPGFVLHTRAAMMADADIVESGFDPIDESLPVAERAEVQLRIYSATRLSFDWQAPSDGWLFVGDRWGRSWQARINGIPTELEGANLVFRAIHVPAGPVRVDMTYRPRFLWLLALSWPLFFVGIFSGLWPLLERRGRAPRAQT